MGEFIRVASVDEVGEGEMTAAEAGGDRVAIARVGGSLYAFGDVCTHKRCSLAKGELEGTTVTCPCHGSQFDLTTGEVLSPPATEPVPVFPLRVEGGDIEVEAGRG